MNNAESGAVYVIVLGQVVVAQDIAQVVAEHDGAATIIVTPRRPDAVAALGGLTGNLRLAFINTPPSNLPSDPLAQAVTARGGRIVLIHDEAETNGERDDYWVLPRPFTSENVLDILNRAG